MSQYAKEYANAEAYIPSPPFWSPAPRDSNTLPTIPTPCTQQIHVFFINYFSDIQSKITAWKMDTMILKVYGCCKYM